MGNSQWVLVLNLHFQISCVFLSATISHSANLVEMTPRIYFMFVPTSCVGAEPSNKLLSVFKDEDCAGRTHAQIMHSNTFEQFEDDDNVE